MADLRAEEARLLARFQALGALRIEASILQPADTLLDLYGEDIRARAYVTGDPLRGEQMLRPDFTVPVVQEHMRESAEPARYTYAGPVFRQQEQDPDRPSEYPQVGYEVFDRSAPEQVEAALFAAFAHALDGLPVTPIIGDMAILSAAVDSLDTTAPRKAALKRHLWRPARFRELLDRFSAPQPVQLAKVSGPQIGLRSAEDVAHRTADLETEAATPPLTVTARLTLEAVMDVSGPAWDALENLQSIARVLPGIAAEVARYEARLIALEAAEVSVDTLPFEISYGRTSMEYYDGFVFGFTAPGLASPVATGGRYDALTRVLGKGREVPAVGGVIRPDLVVQLREARDA